MNDYAGGPNVLVVEDNPNDAELTLRALRDLPGAERVACVEDGVQALDLMFGSEGLATRAGARMPRVILLDLKLPRVDGLEVLRRIKSDPRTKCVPVVILTSSKEERDIAASYSLGANSYVVKPVEFDAYIAAVRDCSRYWSVLNQMPAKCEG
jgi:CheY-like chemotaxis protein